MLLLLALICSHTCIEHASTDFHSIYRHPNPLPLFHPLTLRAKINHFLFPLLRQRECNVYQQRQRETRGEGKNRRQPPPPCTQAQH